MQQTNQKLWDRAQRYLAERQVASAKVTLESLVQRDPAHVPTRLILADIAFGDQRVREAASQALAAMRTVCAETARIMQAEGLPAEAGALFALACAAARATAANISSMRADADAGRETEVAFLNGHVVQCARRHGIPAPANAALLQEMLALPRH